MIDAQQVLHVARLARLELHEDEVQPMADELSKVLGHIDTISQLDLADVEPTSHVVPIDGGLRADIPEPSLPRDVVLAQAPRAGADGFLVPSPQA
jgi:aspartyl-tRNA(Asn)/glutamyl-tRNA(Gln) amidotransferase subunit C